MYIIEYFNRHPKSVGMTYLEHAYFSLEIAYYMGIGSMKAVIHAINPNWFETSTTEFLEYLNKKMDRKDH